MFYFIIIKMFEKETVEEKSYLKTIKFFMYLPAYVFLRWVVFIGRALYHRDEKKQNLQLLYFIVN